MLICVRNKPVEVHLLNAERKHEEKFLEAKGISGGNAGMWIENSLQKNIPEAEPYMLIWNVPQNKYLREKLKRSQGVTTNKCVNSRQVNPFKLLRDR